MSSGPAAGPPVTQQREFWVLMGCAVALGVFGAVAGLVFIGVITAGGTWYDDSDSGWLGGHWWWVAVATAAGVAVGLLRRLTRLPQDVPGLFADLQSGHVEPRLVPGIVAVSTASLIGGASLGPEKALGAMGGGVGSWLARRRALGKEDSQVNTLAGFAGAYGGLFSSTLIVVLLILEVARPGGQRFAKALAAEIVASSVSFGVYFAIAGAVFLDDYQVPSYTFTDWQLLAAVLIAKMATFAVSQASGFVGGPIFPALFIGGTAGVLVHEVIPGVPVGLAFTCLLAAVPGALAPAPFSMVLIAAFLTQVGALQTAPILIAVVTAFLTIEAVKYLLASRKQARGAAAEPAHPA